MKDSALIELSVRIYLFFFKKSPLKMPQSMIRRGGLEEN